MPARRYHMVVGCILLNEENELLIQQRQSTKTGWPDMWDICAATGSAQMGENAQEAIARELKEELGITMDFSECRPYLTVYGPDYFTHYFVRRTHVQIEDIKLQKEEVQAARFVNEEQLKELTEKKQCVPNFLLTDHVFDLLHAQGMQLGNSQAYGKAHIQALSEEDLPLTLALFQKTVRQINSRDYSPEQIEAWINPQRTLESWKQSFQNKKALVAILNGQIAGFADMDDHGYLDRLYIDAMYQGCGAGQELVMAMENWAKTQHITTIETHASITAMPFFRHLGYQVVKKQTVTCQGVRMNHFIMTKTLK